MPITPYLFFNGNAAEAAEFYRGALGAKIETLMRYSDSPEPHPPGMVPPGSENKVMHMTLRIGDAIVMGADDCTGGTKAFQGFSLSLSPKNEAEAKSLFEKLGAGGQVQTPLAKTFFSPCFGMLQDKYGLGWMIHVEPT